MDILGVKIDNLALGDIINQINLWLKGERQHQIATVNPEFIIETLSNPEFKNVLNQTSLSTCDGAGLVWAAKTLKQQKLIRVTGVDLVEAMFRHQPTENWKFYLLGGATDIAESVKKKYSQTNIVGAEDGGRLIKNQWLLENNDQIINNIKNSGANILLVAFGQVRQEMWINKNLALLPNIKVAIGIGGTFDYLSGLVPRAPLFLRRLGLEWLYRLITNPKRFKRIWNATVKFSWLVLKEKFK
ncbi:MAG: WecB/TagA/CpsF family glycosyltransferase [Patescibacteria group bacterium]